MALSIADDVWTMYETFLHRTQEKFGVGPDILQTHDRTQNSLNQSRTQTARQTDRQVAQPTYDADATNSDEENNHDLVVILADDESDFGMQIDWQGGDSDGDADDNASVTAEDEGKNDGIGLTQESADTKLLRRYMETAEQMYLDVLKQSYSSLSERVWKQALTNASNESIAQLELRGLGTSNLSLLMQQHVYGNQKYRATIRKLSHMQSQSMLRSNARQDLNYYETANYNYVQSTLNSLYFYLGFPQYRTDNVIRFALAKALTVITMHNYVNTINVSNLCNSFILHIILSLPVCIENNGALFNLLGTTGHARYVDSVIRNCFFINYEDRFESFTPDMTQAKTAYLAGLVHFVTLYNANYSTFRGVNLQQILNLTNAHNIFIEYETEILPLLTTYESEIEKFYTILNQLHLYNSTQTPPTQLRF